MGEVRFPEISTPILEKVCEYCYYKLRYANACVFPPGDAVVTASFQSY